MEGSDSSDYREESALDLYLRMGAMWLTLRSGCKDVDSVLMEGFVKGEVSEIVGGIATGKSQVSSSITINNSCNLG